MKIDQPTSSTAIMDEFTDGLIDTDLIQAAGDDIDQPSVDFEDDGVTDDELIRAFQDYDCQRRARIEKAEFLRDLRQSNNMSLEGMLLRRS